MSTSQSADKSLFTELSENLTIFANYLVISGLCLLKVVWCDAIDTMPTENIYFRSTCGRFVAVFVSFMTRRAKEAVAVIGYRTRKTNSAQVQCVLLTVVLLQILMRANDIETNPGPSNRSMEETLQELFDKQEVRLQTFFKEKLDTRFRTLENQFVSKVEQSLSGVKNELQSLHDKTSRLEQNTLLEARKTNSAVNALEDRLTKISTDLEEKIDKLEAITRRDNLKLFNIWESPNESHEELVNKVVDVLNDCVPCKKWCPDDIVHARRLGNSNSGNARPKPLIATFRMWSDKMDVLTKGREGLKKKGVSVAGDLTTRQQATIQEHRNRGLRAYYKGNRLVIDGPLQHHPLNRGTFAEVVQRGQPGEDYRRQHSSNERSGEYGSYSHHRSQRQHTQRSGYYAGGEASRPRSDTNITWQCDDRGDADSQFHGVWGDYNEAYYRKAYDWNWDVDYQRSYYAWLASGYHFPVLRRQHDTAGGCNPGNLRPVDESGNIQHQSAEELSRAPTHPEDNQNEVDRTKFSSTDADSNERTTPTPDHSQGEGNQTAAASLSHTELPPSAETTETATDVAEKECSHNDMSIVSHVSTPPDTSASSTDLTLGTTTDEPAKDLASSQSAAVKGASRRHSAGTIDTETTPRRSEKSERLTQRLRSHSAADKRQLTLNETVANSASAKTAVKSVKSGTHSSKQNR